MTVIAKTLGNVEINFCTDQGRNVFCFVVIFFFLVWYKFVCDPVHILGSILTTFTTNEIWKSCIKYESTWTNVVCSFPGTTQISDTISRMFPDAMNSFHIVLWYTYACSNIKSNAIKLVLLKLIKMTTEAEYVAPRAEELNATSKQSTILQSDIIMISINLD